MKVFVVQTSGDGETIALFSTPAGAIDFTKKKADADGFDVGMFQVAMYYVDEPDRDEELVYPSEED